MKTPGIPGKVKIFGDYDGHESVHRPSNGRSQLLRLKSQNLSSCTFLFVFLSFAIIVRAGLDGRYPRGHVVGRSIKSNPLWRRMPSPFPEEDDNIIKKKKNTRTAIYHYILLSFGPSVFRVLFFFPRDRTVGRREMIL